MIVLYWLAVIMLIFEMPVPIYWVVLHAPVEFWRKHVRAAYPIAVFIAWGGGGWLLSHYRAELFVPPDRMSGWGIAAGAVLIGVDIYMLTQVELTLGGRRLVGAAELSRGGELATGGLYRYLRHPRYLGMMCAVLGGCLIVGTAKLWLLAALWWVVALGAIWLEERELRSRFGTAYREYAKRVPALLPFRFSTRS